MDVSEVLDRYDGVGIGPLVLEEVCSVYVEGKGMAERGSGFDMVN